MTVEAIITISTAIVTYLFGVFNKKVDLTETKHIPLVNLCVGVIAGTLCFATGIMDSLINSIVICTVSALGAGGAYDLSKTRGGSDED